jgi:hypothetical protein
MRFGKGRGNTSVHLHVTRVVVSIQIRRDSIFPPAKTEEFDSLGHTAVVGTYHPLIVALIVYSLEVTGGPRTLEEAEPLSPVAEPAPIHAVVYGPAYAFPHAG